MKYFSIFSGIGGFELGIGQAIPNAKCVGFSEIDKWAISIYKRHFKDHKNYSDATKIIPKELPDFDCLVGGFPCQAFSVAGKRQGFRDTQGTLFFEIARIVRQKQPRLLVLENVKGLLSHDQGNSVHTIATTLDELGYDIQWNVCNAKNHGVAQNRERIFIVGHLRASQQSARQIFPIRKSHKKTTRISSHQAHTLTTRYGQALGCGSYIGRTNEVVQLNHPVQIIGGGAKTINNKIRTLMPIECERLQGFPDNWTQFGCFGEGISDRQRYKACGNAVTVNVVAAIFGRIEHLKKT